jgi:hypothetical protein
MKKSVFIPNDDKNSNHGDRNNVLISLAISKGSEILIFDKEDRKELPSMLAIFRYPV